MGFGLVLPPLLLYPLGKTFVFPKVESDPPIRLSKQGGIERKVEFFTKIVWGSIYRTVSKNLGGPKLGQRTNLKNGGTNSRTTDTPPNYRLIAYIETWIAR